MKSVSFETSSVYANTTFLATAGGGKDCSIILN